MAEAIVSIVVGRLTDLLSEESQLLHGLKREIELRLLIDADSRVSEYNVRKN